MAPKVRFSMDLSNPPSSTSLGSADPSEPTPSPPPPFLTPTVEDDEINPKIDDIHILLKQKSPPTLTFDVSKDPETIDSLAKEIPENVRQEPATIPEVPYIKLVCRYLPWEIEIESSSPDEKNAFVSVADVFGGLYCALRIPVTDGEFDKCPKPESVRAAFENRCQGIADEQGQSEADLERKGGIRRVDYLQGNLMFGGLTALKPRARHLKFSVVSSQAATLTVGRN